MRGRVAPHLLGAGIALGIGWRLLQTTVPGRLDFALSAGLLLLVLAVLHGRGLLHLPETDRLLLGVPAILLIGAIIWRDSETLFGVNLLALSGLIAFARPVRVGLHGQLLHSGVGDLLRRLVHAGRGAALGAWSLLVAVRGPDSVQAPGSRWAAGVGVLAISPVLLLFSLLLGSADPVFRQLLESVVDPELVVEQVVPLLFWSWLGAGLLWALTRAPSATDRTPAGGHVDSPAVTGALVPIAILFLAFLVVQSRYLFGGRAVVLGTADLSFAEYARHGFFELVTVSAMMLPILLFADWVAAQHTEADRRRFRRLALSLLVLLAGLLGSALLRMSIYTSEYGLTEDRLFATVFMGWLAFVFAWFGATVLRRRRERFTAGALGSALVTLLLLNAVGPDEVIVRTNAWRVRKGRSLDAEYLASLGAGAVPAALRVLPALPATERCDGARLLVERWGKVASGREDVWTIERWRATGVLLGRLAIEAKTACRGIRIWT
jgi:hypothetical protein